MLDQTNADPLAELKPLPPLPPATVRPIVQATLANTSMSDVLKKAEKAEKDEKESEKISDVYAFFAKKMKMTAFNHLLLTAPGFTGSGVVSPTNYDAFLEFERNVDLFCDRILGQK